MATLMTGAPNSPPEADSHIADRLRQIGHHIEAWRDEARRIGRMTDAAVAFKSIDDAHLIDLERTSGEIYAEIAAFNLLVPEIAATNPIVAGQLAEVGDALQLVLLEITELGTRMYSLRSGEVETEEG
jgi:hypothetical protein